MKSASLAILGGAPAFEAPLYVGRPNVGDRTAFMRRLNEMLDRNWLTNDGPLVREFEARIAEHAGVAHCVAMCNATVALEVAIRAAGLKGEVIVPSFTFVATAHALQWQEITPVFCDIDPATHNLDPVKLEQMITPRTSGIIGVHLWGRAAPVEALAEIAARRNLTLMFDAAHAIHCTHRGKRIGAFGKCEVFSFHATKALNSLEGGAVVTNDGAFANKLRLMRNFGFSGYDRVDYAGTNGKMSEASAAMGLTNLDALGDFVRANQRNHASYCDLLRGLPGISVMDYSGQEESNYHYIVAEIDADTFGLTRDELVSVLHAERVVARRYFFPGCHRMEPYRSYFPHAGLLLPETERLAQRLVLLPNGTSIDAGVIAKIAGILRAAHASSREIRETLPPSTPGDKGRS